MSMEAAYAAAAVALDASTADRRALEWAAASQIEMDLAADLKDLSLSGFDEDEAFSGRDVLFPNGYSRLADGLAEGLDIRTGQPIVSIATQIEGCPFKRQGHRSRRIARL